METIQSSKRTPKSTIKTGQRSKTNKQTNTHIKRDNFFRRRKSVYFFFSSSFFTKWQTDCDHKEGPSSILRSRFGVFLTSPRRLFATVSHSLRLTTDFTISFSNSLAQWDYLCLVVGVVVARNVVAFSCHLHNWNLKQYKSLLNAWTRTLKIIITTI